ncbi:MAG: hypothetical protein IKM43_02655 [Clostridia bacterium]|nr:hypothetical protein [Clostridia bacterium]
MTKTELFLSFWEYYTICYEISTIKFAYTHGHLQCSEEEMREKYSKLFKDCTKLYLEIDKEIGEMDFNNFYLANKKYLYSLSDLLLDKLKNAEKLYRENPEKALDTVENLLKLTNYENVFNAEYNKLQNTFPTFNN